MVSEQGLENLFLFFDDYSEIDHDARYVMVAALEAFFNAPAYQRKSLKFPIRVAIYWGDNFGTRLVGNMVPEEVGTDPYSANFYRKEQPGIVVDEKFGNHVKAIFEARCDFFGLKLDGGLLASSTHEETKELCAFLARISGGNMRILARYMQHLHRRDIDLGFKDLHARSGRFFGSERDNMVRSALQYYSDDAYVIDQHLSLCDWIEDECRRSASAQPSSVVRTRYLPLDNRCALKLKALVNGGIIHPVTDLYLPRTAGGPTTLFAINEGLRLGWIGEASTDFSDVTDEAFLNAFKRVELRLKDWNVGP